MYDALNKADQAEQSLRRVLSIEEQHHPETHTSVIRAHSELADFLVSRYQYEQAITVWNRYFARFEKSGQRSLGQYDALILPLAQKARAEALARKHADAAATLRLASSNLLSRVPGDEATQTAALKKLLTVSKITQSGTHGLGTSSGSELARAIYALELKNNAPEVRPALSYLLWLDVFEKANRLGGDDDEKFLALSTSLENLMMIRQRHWPADDNDLEAIRKALLDLQSNARS